MTHIEFDRTILVKGIPRKKRLKESLLVSVPFIVDIPEIDVSEAPIVAWWPNSGHQFAMRDHNESLWIPVFKKLDSISDSVDPRVEKYYDDFSHSFGFFDASNFSSAFEDGVGFPSNGFVSSDRRPFFAFNNRQTYTFDEFIHGVKDVDFSSVDLIRNFVSEQIHDFSVIDGVLYQKVGFPFVGFVMKNINSWQWDPLKYPFRNDYYNCVYKTEVLFGALRQNILPNNSFYEDEKFTPIRDFSNYYSLFDEDGIRSQMNQLPTGILDKIGERYLSRLIPEIIYIPSWLPSFDQMLLDELLKAIVRFGQKSPTHQGSIWLSKKNEQFVRRWVSLRDSQASDFDTKLNLLKLFLEDFGEPTQAEITSLYPMIRDFVTRFEYEIPSFKYR